MRKAVEKAGLEHFASSPTRPPSYVFYFRNADTRSVKACHGFCSKGMSKGFLDEVAKHCTGEIEWEDDDILRMGDILVSGTDLREVFTNARPVEVPYPHTAMAARIMGVEQPHFRYSDPDQPEEQPEGRRKRRQKSAEAPAGRRTPSSAEGKRRKSEDGLYTASQLADEFGLSGSKLRSILRDNGIAKPYTWAEGDELDKIRQLVKGAKK